MSDLAGFLAMFLGGPSAIVTLNDAISITEQLTVHSGPNVGLVEGAITVSDAFNNIAHFNVIPIEVVTLTDSVPVIANLISTLSDQISLIDNSVASSGIFISISESVGLSDSVITIFTTPIAYTASLSETVNIADAISLMINAVVFLADTVPIIDNTVLSQASSLLFNELYFISESISNSYVFIASLADTILSAENLGTQKTAIINNTENITLLEDLAITFNNAVSGLENVILSEIVNVSRSMQSIFADSLIITDSLSVIAHRNVQIFEIPIKINTTIVTPRTLALLDFVGELSTEDNELIGTLEDA